MSKSNQPDDIAYLTKLASSYTYEIKMYEDTLTLTLAELEYLEEQGDELERIASLQAQCQAIRNCIIAAEESYFEACADLWIAESNLKYETDK